MDIVSIGNQMSSGAPISDRAAGNNIAPPTVKSATPVETRNPVMPTDHVHQTATAEQVNSAIKSINKTVQATASNIEFSVDNDTNKLVVKIIDQQTKQVLRQIPTEEVIEIAKSLDKLQGLLIKQTA